MLPQFLNMIVRFFSRDRWLKHFDSHLQELLRGASAAFLIKVLGTGIGFVLSIVLAKVLGVEDVGIYYLALTTITIGAVVSRLGLDNALLRFVASTATHEDWQQVAGVYRQGLLLGLVGSVIITTCIVGGASLIADRIYNKPELTQPLQIMGLSIIPIALFTLHAEMLKGLKHTRDALLITGFGVPFLTLSFVLVLGNQYGLAGIAWSYVFATLIVLLVSKILWNRAAYQIKGMRGYFGIRRLLGVSLPLFTVALMNLVIGSASTVALGFWGDSESVGIYNVALRAAMLASFALVAVNSIAAPKFAAIYAKGDTESLRALARNASSLMLAISMPFLVLLIFAPTTVLRFFGTEFLEGYLVLIVLAVGQFVNLATGSVGFLLMMCGYEKLMRNNIFVAMIIAVVLNVLLVPQYGALGAAVASSVSVACLNLVSVYLVYRKLSVIVLPIPSFVRFG